MIDRRALLPASNSLETFVLGTTGRAPENFCNEGGFPLRSGPSDAAMGDATADSGK
jgi:hypothetical protein